MLTDLIIAGIFSIVGNAMRLNTDFEKELAFYGAYHQSPINQAIHFVFIPLIWWSGCVALCYIPILGAKDLEVAGHPITWGTAMFFMYSAYYIVLDTFTGSLASLFLLGMYLQASGAVSAEKDHDKASEGKGKKGDSRPMRWWKFAIICHVASWAAQIGPGHAMAEGVKPALVDSLGQALGVAPMFAVLEGIWAVGIAPELKERCLINVAANRVEMCTASGGQYPWC
jgi:uncharacterized membrane protein YGL010W